jgi:hypothetical protein
MDGRRRTARLLACSCLVGVALVLAPVPAGVRTLVVLPVALLVPGLCITRRLELREPLIEAALAFPISATLWVAVAQAELYLRAWSPKVGLVVLLLASAASLRPDPRPPPALTSGAGHSTGAAK